MSQRRNARNRQRGAALLAMLAVIMLGASWYLYSRLNEESGGINAVRKNRNAEVLQRAKLALIGYVAAQAAKAGENNPGALPCPENPGDFDSTTGRQGLVGSSCGTTTIGRFPWRTLGLDQLVDASGESLWYVVSPGWGRASGSNTSINSNSLGQLTVDGVANAAVALIIAPGPAFSVSAATGCGAWNQVRPSTGTPDWRNYVECENATQPADVTFVTTGPSSSFNDQVLKITAAEILPSIEAAIAHRIEREIAPVLKTVYANIPVWGLSSATPLFPFAAPFADTSTSSFEGAGTREGLLPMVRASACTAGVPGCPPVNANFVNWGSPNAAKTGGTPTLSSNSCTLIPAGNPTSVQCTLTTPGPSGVLSVRVQATINPFRAIRSVDATMAQNAPSQANTGSSGFASGCTGAWVIDSAGATLSCTGSINVSGPSTFVLNVPIPASGSLLADHALTDPSDPTTGWFARNRWYDLIYYATSADFLAGGALSCSGATCLSVTNMSPAGNKRTLLILSGRLLPSQVLAGGSRPSANLAYYLEDATNRDNDLSYTKATPGATVNDRFIIVDTN